MAMDREDTIDIRHESAIEAERAQEAEIGEEAYLGMSRASWSAIWAGFFLGTMTYLVLNVLGLALGITWITQAAVAEGQIQLAAGIWLIVTTLIAFFVGGFVTGRMMGLPGEGTGAMNGLLYGSFSIIFLAVFSLFPAMQVVPFVTNLFQWMGGPGMQITPGEAQAAAWWSFFGLVIALCAATAGGFFGARHAEIEPLTTGERERYRAPTRRRASV
jgi:hypothetical protein